MPELAGDTRSSLLLRMRGNDDHAWAEFFRIYSPAVFHYAQRRGLQKNDAEDVTQDVMIAVANAIRTFTYQPDKGRFRDWLGTIAKRRIAKHWNATQSRATHIAWQEASGPIDAEWMDEYQAAIVRIAIENIRPRYADITWQAFWSTWKQGENPAQVALRLEVPIEVVYNAKSRILKHLEAEVLRIADDCSIPID